MIFVTFVSLLSRSHLSWTLADELSLLLYSSTFELPSRLRRVFRELRWRTELFVLVPLPPSRPSLLFASFADSLISHFSNRSMSITLFLEPKRLLKSVTPTRTRFVCSSSLVARDASSDSAFFFFQFVQTGISSSRSQGLGFQQAHRRR